MHFNVDLFLDTLSYMLKGMLGIFCVTVFLMGSIWLLNLLTADRKKTPKKAPSEQEHSDDTPNDRT